MATLAPLPPSSVRKRKRVMDPQPVLAGPFTIQPHTPPFDAPSRVTPTVVLPRSHIPISWLSGAPSRLFETPCDQPPLCSPGYMIISKLEGERQLSAIEMVQEGVYAIYKLSTLLRMKDIRKAASDSRGWTGQAGLAGQAAQTDGGLDQAMQAVRLDMGLPLESVDIAMANCEERTTTEPNETLPSPPPTAAGELPPTEPMQTPPPMSEILDQVRRQYLDTLYLTKTSLAYFSKSTLSRARASCHDFEETPPANRFDELNSFLRQMVLPLDKMDIKYRKSLVQCALENDVDDKTVFRTDEESFIQRWRAAVFEDRFVGENDTELKGKLEELKNRETELQIILLLEILALNKEHPPSAPEETKEKGKDGKEKKSKKKSKKAAKNAMPDPDILLDLLVDRLCIWHSIGADLSTGKDEFKESSAPEKDHLRHFSIEVIMAFYASKLPEKCASINKKFGGHSSTKSSTPRPKLKPTLKKTLSSSKLNSSSSKLAQSDSARPSVSRSGTEPLSFIAPETTSAPRTARGGTLSSRSFTKRVVELDNKLKLPAKKIAVDEELKSAISALSKPNRAAAASEFLNAAEQRLKVSKKPKKTTRNPAAVMVAATPKKVKRDSFGGKLDKADNVPSTPNEVAPKAKQQRLPPSMVCGTPSVTPPPNRATRPAFGMDVVMDTPNPPRSVFQELRKVAPKTAPRNASKPAPRSVPNNVPSPFETPKKKQAAFETPKKKPVTIAEFWSPVAGGGSNKTATKNATSNNVDFNAFSSPPREVVGETPMRNFQNIGAAFMSSPAGNMVGETPMNQTRNLGFGTGFGDSSPPRGDVVSETPVKSWTSGGVRFTSGFSGGFGGSSPPRGDTVGETPLKPNPTSNADSAFMSSPGGGIVGETPVVERTVRRFSLEKTVVATGERSVKKVVFQKEKETEMSGSIYDQLGWDED
ncbi:DNA replication regulator SLD3-domain-containing protein [Pyronema domesticum]|nr:DNA replication regulator SLD3-domain-containing protein [Pyronema domesticum]